MKVKMMTTSVLVFATLSLGCHHAQTRTAYDTPSVYNRPSVSPVRWGGQKTCPVTGDELGSMGEPIAVTVRDETIWVCCDNCTAAVKDDPDKYIQKVQLEIAGSRKRVVPLDDSHDDSNTHAISPSRRGCRSGSGNCSSCRAGGF